MSQFRVRTEQDLYDIEAVSYVIDGQGLKLTGDGGVVLASFPAYESMVRIDALVKAEPESEGDK